MRLRILYLAAAVLVVAVCGWIFLADVRIARLFKGFRSPGFEIVYAGDSTYLIDSANRISWLLGHDEDGKPGWIRLAYLDERALEQHPETGNSLPAHEAINRRTDSVFGQRVNDDGFSRIRLRQVLSGYIAVQGKINGNPVNLLVDTGSPGSRLDRLRTARFGLKWRKNSSMFECRVDSLTVGNVQLGGLRVCEHDMTEVNNAIELYGDPPFDGIIGGDVLRDSLAVIDYKDYALYLFSRKADVDLLEDAQP